MASGEQAVVFWGRVDLDTAVTLQKSPGGSIHPPKSNPRYPIQRHTGSHAQLVLADLPPDIRVPSGTDFPYSEPLIKTFEYVMRWTCRPYGTWGLSSSHDFQDGRTLPSYPWNDFWHPMRSGSGISWHLASVELAALFWTGWTLPAQCVPCLPLVYSKMAITQGRILGSLATVLEHTSLCTLALRHPWPLRVCKQGPSQHCSPCSWGY